MEALIVLVAVRAWKEVWSSCPTRLLIRSDSMATLGAIDKMRSSNVAMNRVMRELAAERLLARFGLTFRLRHIAGARNEWADALSRLYAPGSAATVPGPLRSLRRREVAPRGAAFWTCSRKESPGEQGDEV